MELKRYERKWLDIVKAQEERLRTDGMDADGALRLGLIMARLAREKYKKSISIRIITNGQTTFEYYMEGTDSLNRWWMDKKLNTCRATSVSSVRALIEVGEGLRDSAPEFEIENNYALCGGCFPLRTPGGRLIGYVLCSGMAHEEDHQLIADALVEYLGIDVPSLLD